MWVIRVTSTEINACGHITLQNYVFIPYNILQYNGNAQSSSPLSASYSFSFPFYHSVCYLCLPKLILLATTFLLFCLSSSPKDAQKTVSNSSQFPDLVLRLHHSACQERGSLAAAASRDMESSKHGFLQFAARSFSIMMGHMLLTWSRSWRQGLGNLLLF